MAGFVANPGTNFSVGQTAIIAQRLNDLGKRLGITIHGISGYRTPSHSVAVGGSANDPHTQGKAADIGVNSSLRTSAAQLTDAQLASVGLYRPFSGAQEINHVQLKPGTEKFTHVYPISDLAGKGPQGLLSNQQPGVGIDPVRTDTTLAQGVTGGAAGDLASGVVNDLWNAIAPQAQYAGLFVLLLGAGVWLAVVGLSRSTGLKEPA